MSEEKEKINHALFSTRLALFYKEPLEQVIGKDKYNKNVTMKNPRVQANHQWLLKNMSENYLGEFYLKVIETFTPTSTVPYPLPANLLEIRLNEFKPVVDPYEPERISPDDDISLIGMAEGYERTHDLAGACPDKNATVGEIYNEVNNHNDDNNYIVRKYGVFGALKAWGLFKAINTGEKISEDKLFSDWYYFTNGVKRGKSMFARVMNR